MTFPFPSPRPRPPARLLERVCASPGARIVNMSSPAEMYGRVDLDDVKV